MITGYEDLRNELVEIFGGQVTEQNIDVAVQALIEEERTTATPALAEINALAQSSEGRVRLRSMLSHWIKHEHDKHDTVKERQAKLALSHLLEVFEADRSAEVS